MRKKLIVTLLGLFVASIEVASAQSIGGLYQVSGENFDGSKYFGTARIRIRSDTDCRITWLIAGITWRGICMRDGTAFAVSYTHGHVHGVALYRLRPDGALEGSWTVSSTPGAGKDRLEPRG